MMSRPWIERREEDFFNWLTERVAARQPGWLVDDEKARGWEGLILNHWPKLLTASWWIYIFGNPDKVPLLNLPERDWGEIWYWLRNRHWRLGWLTDETLTYRIYCRWRGHPSGEVYWNPGGSEPDHRCKDCGEELG